MIRDNITKQIGEAMKAHDEIRLSTLRMLSSALNYEFIAKQHELSEEEEIVVVKKEAKKRKDAIEAYEKAGAKDRAEKEKKELQILQEYLPPEMPVEELEKLVDEALKQSSNFGEIMKIIMAETGGKADGSKVAELVKSKL